MIDPILYSFRRCPYAMRARLAIASAGVRCELREIVLREKAHELLQASPKGTVPVVVDGERVIDESLDVMLWALAKADPEGWLDMPSSGMDLIRQFDGPFKAALDRVKYASRYPDLDVEQSRAVACDILRDLNERIGPKPWIFGDVRSLADMAILPFIRQFAFVDRAWFDTQPWQHLQRWLDAFLDSNDFAAVMAKYPKWQRGDPVTYFPDVG